MRNWGEIDKRLDPTYYSLVNKLYLANHTKYKVVKMSEAVIMQRGRFGHRPRNDPKLYGGIYPFIQTGNIVEASKSNSSIKYTQTLNELGLLTSKLFEPNTLIITIAANIGDTAILDYQACFPDSLVALIPKGNITIQYLNEYFRLIKEYIVNIAPQSAQKNINIQQLASIPIVVPPIHVQDKVDSIMDIAYSLKSQKENEASDLLNNIDCYLLGELGIVMPDDTDHSLDKRIFYVHSTDVLFRRLDPKNYSVKFYSIFDSIKNSALDRKNLRQVIIDDISGNWGKDLTEEDEELVTCLTIRATEFDNRYNLNLDNSRVKFRKYPPNVFERLNLCIGDILIEKSGGSEDQPVGRVAIIDQDIAENHCLAYSNFIHKIVADTQIVLPQYLFEYLKLMHNIKATEVMQNQTNGIRNLIMPEYFGQYILLPDMDKQIEIANHITSIRNQAKQLENEAQEMINQAKAEVEKILMGDSQL